MHTDTALFYAAFILQAGTPGSPVMVTMLHDISMHFLVHFI
jgi:cytochrome c oxidase assembly factor CtaG